MDFYLIVQYFIKVNLAKWNVLLREYILLIPELKQQTLWTEFMQTLWQHILSFNFLLLHHYTLQQVSFYKDLYFLIIKVLWN